MEQGNVKSQMWDKVRIHFCNWGTAAELEMLTILGGLHTAAGRHAFLVGCPHVLCPSPSVSSLAGADL